MRLLSKSKSKSCTELLSVLLQARGHENVSHRNGRTEVGLRPTPEVRALRETSVDANETAHLYLEKLEDNQEPLPKPAKARASERNAGIMANSRKGYRRCADSPIVKLAILKELLKIAGYTFFLNYYLSVKA